MFQPLGVNRIFKVPRVNKDTNFLVKLMNTFPSFLQCEITKASTNDLKEKLREEFKKASGLTASPCKEHRHRRWLMCWECLQSLNHALNHHYILFHSINSLS